MVLILFIAALWVGGSMLLMGLLSAAARGDRPTTDHLDLLRRATLWVPPRVDPLD